MGKVLSPLMEIRAAMFELAEEKEYLFQRSADRYNAIEWVIDQLHQNKVPSRETVKNRIIYGRD